MGATLPILGSAALSSVPGGRYAVASAVNSSVRQIGGVLGISFLVVLIGTPAPPVPRTRSAGAGCSAPPVSSSVPAWRSWPPGRGTGGAADEGSGEARAALLSVPEIATAAAAPASRSLMHELGPEGRERVERSGERVRLQAGETLFEAGDPAGAAFSVLSGRVDVVTADGRVRSLGAGDVIGELAMLTGGARSATVRAHRDTVLLRIAPEALDHALDEHPATARSLVRVLASQLASPPVRERQRQPVIVAVVGLHPGAPVAAVAEAMRSRLARWLRVAVSGEIDVAGLERLEGPRPGAADGAVEADRGREGRPGLVRRGGPPGRRRGGRGCRWAPTQRLEPGVAPVLRTRCGRRPGRGQPSATGWSTGPSCSTPGR